MPKRITEQSELEVNGNVAVQENTSPALEKTAEQESLPAKDKAYSIVFDSHNQKWCAVELLFNFSNATFGGLKVVESNPNRNIITERFHVLIGQNLL